MPMDQLQSEASEMTHEREPSPPRRKQSALKKIVSVLRGNRSKMEVGTVPPPLCFQEATEDSPTNSPKVVRRFKGKKKERTSGDISVWRPKGHGRWECSDMVINLQEVRVQDLCLAETRAIQHVAITELRKHGIGVSHGILKGSNLRKKIERLSLRSKKQYGVEEPAGAVFGHSLEKVIQKEQADSFSQSCRLSPPINMTTPSPTPRRRINSSTSAEPLRIPEQHSSVHMSTRPFSRKNSLLIDALSLPTSPTPESQRRMSLEVCEPQVPQLVTKAMQFIESKAMMTEGIFRIPGAKTRINQIKKQVDAGVVQLSECQHPHDVACLLKEFFRCLPEPLLTKELYSAFLSIRKLESRSDRRDCLRLLCMLLPQANRDTLQQLLCFLDQVAMYSSEIILIDGTESMGNRMTEENLALIFGPNILHKRKLNDHTSHQRPQSHIQEELETVCKVTEDLIRMQRTLFTIPADLYDKVAGQLFLCDPEALDVVLRRHYTIVRPRPLAEFQRVHSSDYSNDGIVFNQHLTLSKSVDVIDEGVTGPRRKLWGTTSDLGLLDHENGDGQAKHQRFSSMGNDPLLNGHAALNAVGLRESLRLPCGSRDSAFSSCSVFDSRSSSEGFGMSTDQLQGSTEDLSRNKKSSKQPVNFNSLGRKDKVLRNYHRNASLPPGITVEDEDIVDGENVIESLEAIKSQLQDTMSDTPVEILVSEPPLTGFTHFTSTPNHSSPDDGITVCDNGLDLFANTILSPELSATCEQLMASHSTSSSQDDVPSTARAFTPANTSTPHKPRPSSCGISTYTGTSL